MKLTLLSFFLAFAFFTVDAQIVNIPDANFKNALLNHNPVINTNGDGEIQVSEAAAFTGTINVTARNISDLTGINSFFNITTLSCSGNQLTNLNINDLNSLNTIYAGNNRLIILSLNNLSSLQLLECSQNLLTSLQLTNLHQLQVLSASYNNFTSFTFSGFPSLREISISRNALLTNLIVDNLPNLKYLSCNQCKLTNLAMTGLPLLDTLFCTDNKLTTLVIPNPSNLKVLAATNNLLSNLPDGLVGLRYLDVSYNQITNFSLENMNFLGSVYISNNLCNSLSLSNKPFLKFVRCNNNLINNLQLSNLPSLTSLECRTNNLTSLSLSGYNLLEDIYCENNQINSLLLSNLNSLKVLSCDGNQLVTLSLSNLPSLNVLTCSRNQMTSLSLNNTPALYEINCVSNQLSSMPFLTPSALPNLRHLIINENRMPRLLLNNFPFLYRIEASNNPIDSLRLKNLPLLEWMRIENNKLTRLILDTLPRLKVLYCGKTDSLRNIALQLPILTAFFCDSTNLISIDLSQTLASQVEITNNPFLQYINMRNTNNNQFVPIKFFNNNALQFICVDDAEKIRVTDSIFSQLPGQGVVVSTVCNYTPAISSTIKGVLRFDVNGNGCNNVDSVMMNVRINNNDGTYSTSAFTNHLGQYRFSTSSSTDTVKVEFEQPSWFNIVPPTHIINIPNQGITVIADFCVTPNGIHPDLEIIILPINTARPGFEALYKIVYRNKGNQQQSGTVQLLFNASKLSFLSAIPNVANQTLGNLGWSYTNLSPYETRIINLQFLVNVPPVVNIGDTLAFTANVNPILGDETPVDNTYNYNQIVRGAFDPNDKEVVEGSAIDISRVNDYLNYIIRFQNIGNADAVNVIVKDSLDDNLDFNSIIPTTSSHSYTANVNESNKVEFVFKNINLPGKMVNEPASHGFIAFKVKPKKTLVAGNTIFNKAAIYFDFNPPIITNIVSTTVTKTNLVNSNNQINIYSNPVQNVISFKTNPDVQVKGINVYNNLGQRIYTQTISNTNQVYKINSQAFPCGLLFLQVLTTTGSIIEKIVKVK